MKKTIVQMAIICLMAGVAFKIQAAVHDLAADFSLVSNPTPLGWQYSERLSNGGGPLSTVVTGDWNSSDFGSGQPGWPGGVIGAHDGYAQRIDNGVPVGSEPNGAKDDPFGTVMAYGHSSVLWKAPPSDPGGVATISGSTWNLRKRGFSGTWKLWKNDSVLLISGAINDSGTSANPLKFENGTGGGGPTSLTNINYVAGDTFRFEVPDDEEFIGINFTITTSTNVPVGLGINAPPQSQNLNAGATLNLGVVAVGAPPLYYQWRKDGVNMLNATNYVLLVTNATTNTAGAYDVVVSNSTQSLTSSPPAIVTVFRPPTVYPGIPHDLKADFSLSSNPTDLGWQYSEDLANGGGPLPAVVLQNWNQPDFGPGQPGWPGGVVGVHDGYAQRIDNGFVGIEPSGFKDAPVGTIIGYGHSSVLWTAPPDDAGGIANISGSIWNVRKRGQGGNWYVWKNDSILLSSGTINDASGDSAGPLNIEQGTGGAGSSGLQYIVYKAGDTFRFEVPNDEEFIGLNFTIYTAAPTIGVPPVLVSAVRDASNYKSVTIKFSEQVQASAATNVTSYGLNNSNSVTGASLSSDGQFVTLTTSVNVSQSLTNILTVNNILDVVGNVILTNSHIAIVAVDSTTLVLEAEHYNVNASPAGGSSWIFTNAPPLLLSTDVNTNYSADGAMLADPNTGRNLGSPALGSVPSNSPRLDFNCQFNTTGKYYVWVRGVGDSSPGSSANDSVFIGLDGALTTGITGFPQGQGYAWANSPVGSSGPIVISTPGVHTINVWMREDGLAVDKLLLTTSPEYAPIGIGPMENTGLSPKIALEHSGANLILTWPGSSILQSATNVAGPYVDILGSGSPFTVTPVGAQEYYRMRQ